MQEAITLTFVFQSIAVILVLTGIAIVLVNIKAKTIKNK